MDGRFISSNSVKGQGHNAERIGNIPIVCGNGNRAGRTHNISNSHNQRDLRKFFIRPDLFIEIRNEQTTFRPELQIVGTNILRQYLNVRIVNRGKGVATNCSAKLRITGWTENTKPPSTDSKTLRWNDTSTTKTIYPRGEEEILNVVFADSDLQARAQEDHLDIFSYVATNEALTDRQNRNQDGFGEGDFDAEISVRSEEGGYCFANMFIRIERNHRNIRMNLSHWDRIILRYKRRPSIIRFISNRLRRWIR